MKREAEVDVSESQKQNDRRKARRWVKRKSHREVFLVYVFLLPALLIFFTYKIIPLVWNVVLSFQFWSPTKPPRYAGLYHYEEMLLHDSAFWEIFGNTLFFLISGPAAVAAALFFAVLVNRPLRGRNVYRTLIFLSYPLMAVSVGIIWQWLFNEEVGLFNYLLMSAGIIEKPVAFLNQSATALPAVMLASMWQLIGFYMIILLTGLQSIPPHLYEAARIDGANGRQQFFAITLPLLRPSIFLCLIVAVTASFTAFDLIYVMTQGGPGRATDLLITYIYSSGFGLGQFDYAAALTVVMFLLFMLIALLLNAVSGGDAGRVDSGR